jgi:hypothetical protein
MALGWLTTKTFTAKTFTTKTFMTKTCFGVFGLTLGILGPLSVAGAADFYEPPPPRYQGPPPGYYPPPPAPVPYGPPVVQGPVEGACRVILRPGVDPYGREVVRRVRICEEEEVAVAPAYPAPPPPRYGYGPRYYDGPRPYGWR